MDLDLVFLGTAASAPTAARGTSATLVRRGGDRLLVDCGEGTQRQLLRSDIGLVDLEDVFLTHLHADHVLGLPGMLKTFGLRGRDTAMRVHGPRGTRALLGALGVVALGYALRETERPGRFDVDAADAVGVPDGPARGALQRGEPVRLDDGRVVAPEEVVGPARRGRSVVLTGDTSPAASGGEAATGADVLVHEATFLADERARARETGHSTAAEAALVAREAGVALLALTHLSARYAVTEVAEESCSLFPRSVVPRDFDLVTVPFPERGSPELVARGGRRVQRDDVGSGV